MFRNILSLIIIFFILNTNNTYSQPNILKTFNNIVLHEKPKNLPDLELINKIEQEDENEQLEKLQAKLKRLKELKDSINSLSKFTSTLKPTNKAAFSKAKEDISSLSKKIKDSLNELKNK